jgi:hypothetical protein
MRVFVSYRRDDTQWVAGRLHDRLAEAYGEDNVFFDVDDIPMGADFRDVIRETLERVDVVLAVVGEGWNLARLAQDTDFVRAELREALALKKRVVPVLVGDTKMPTAAVLPADLEELAYLNAVRLRADPDFATDADRLVASLGPTTNGCWHLSPAAVVALLIALVAGLGMVVAVLVLGGGGHGGGSSGDRADRGSSGPALSMPANAEIYQHPVTEVVPRLLQMGLHANSQDGPCSNTTDKGLVSQVTVGEFPDHGVIYGEEGQEFIDVDLRNRVTTGTEVTVWTPLFRPCP